MAINERTDEVRKRIRSIKRRVPRALADQQLAENFMLANGQQFSAEIREEIEATLSASRSSLEHLTGSL